MAIYAHVVDSNMAFVQVRNDSNVPIILGQYVHLGYIAECLEEDCYLVSPEAHGLAGKAPIKIYRGSWVQKALLATTLLSGIAHTAFAGTATQMAQPEPGVKPKAAALLTSSLNPSLEMILSNGITTYGKPEVSAQYSEVVKRYPDLWADKGRVVRLSEEDWMTIPLVIVGTLQKLPQKSTQRLERTGKKLTKPLISSTSRDKWNSQTSPHLLRTLSLLFGGPSVRKTAPPHAKQG